MFTFVIILIVILTGAGLLYPFWVRGTTLIPMGEHADRDQEKVDLEIEKQTLIQSLSDLDLEVAQGRHSEEDHKRLRAIEEVRLGKLLDRVDQLNKEAAARGKKNIQDENSGSFGAKGLVTIALAIVTMGGSWAIYTAVEGKIGLGAKKLLAERPQTPAAGPGGMPDPIKMVARLEERLKGNPNDLEGQMMAGRSYMTLNRLEDARKAWAKVVELDYGNHEAHYFLGFLILQTSPRSEIKKLEEALQHFDTALVKVPREPAILWYRGIVLVHLRDYSSADESWTTAFQNLPPGTEDSELVKEALQKLRAGNPPLL